MTRLQFACRRATFLLQSGPPDDPDRRHLFIVMNHPVGADRECLIVPICTLRRRQQDTTCRLYPGDHDFIRAESIVDYRYAEIARADWIACDGISKGMLREEIFARVHAGFDGHRLVPKRVLKFFDTHCRRSG